MNTVPPMIFTVGWGASGRFLNSWKAYRYGVEHMDDPDSWSDEPEQTEKAEEIAEEEEEGRT